MKKSLWAFMFSFMAGLAPIGLAHEAHAQGSAGTPLAEMPAGAYTLDKTHASLVWKVSHLGLSNYTARFTDFDATINLQPNNLTASSVKATIDPMSVRTDYPHPEKKDFDAKLATGEGWFNANAFPQITFTATDLQKTDDHSGIMTGELTFLGVTKPVSLDVTFNKAMLEHPFAGKPALGFSATGKLQRSDWGMDTYLPNIGDTVHIMIEAEFFKAE